MSKQFFRKLEVTQDHQVNNFSHENEPFMQVTRFRQCHLAFVLIYGSEFLQLNLKYDAKSLYT